MAPTTRTFSILVAFILAIGMIAGAFFLSGTGNNVGRVKAEPNEEMLRAYAAKDTDQDGLLDWKESLYGTDPADAHSVRLDMTDGEAVAGGHIEPRFTTEDVESAEEALAAIPGEPAAPESLTDRFAKEFLGRYLTASGGQALDDAAEQALVVDLLAEFSSESGALFASEYIAADVRTSASTDTLAYTGAIETVLANALPVTNGDILLLTQALIEKNDQSVRPQIERYATAYREAAASLMTLSVPPPLSGAHLQVARSLDSVSRAAAVIARYEEDPVAVLGAMGVFPPARDDIFAALAFIGNAAIEAGPPAAGTPGALIVELARTYEP